MLQQQREQVADCGVRTGQKEGKMEQQALEISRLQSHIQTMTKTMENQRRELTRRDKEIKQLQADLKQRIRQATPDLSMESLPRSISGYNKKPDAGDSWRQIALLQARLQQVEAENERYQRLAQQERAGKPVHGGQKPAARSRHRLPLFRYTPVLQYCMRAL